MTATRKRTRVEVDSGLLFQAAEVRHDDAIAEPDFADVPERILGSGSFVTAIQIQVHFLMLKGTA